MSLIFSSSVACWTSFCVASGLVNNLCAVAIALSYSDFKLLSISCNISYNGSAVVMSATFIAASSSALLVSCPCRASFAFLILSATLLISCCVDCVFTKIWRPSSIALSYSDFKLSGAL